MGVLSASSHVVGVLGSILISTIIVSLLLRRVVWLAIVVLDALIILITYFFNFLGLSLLLITLLIISLSLFIVAFFLFLLGFSLQLVLLLFHLAI